MRRLVSTPTGVSPAPIRGPGAGSLITGSSAARAHRGFGILGQATGAGAARAGSASRHDRVPVDGGMCETARAIDLREEPDRPTSVGAWPEPSRPCRLRAAGGQPRPVALPQATTPSQSRAASLSWPAAGVGITAHLPPPPSSALDLATVHSGGRTHTQTSRAGRGQTGRAHSGAEV
jgi:hypothetical protein